MSRRRQDSHTLRVPPVVSGVAGHTAEALREPTTLLDDVSRARMERSLVQAWRTHAAARVPLPRSQKAPNRTAWVASLAVSAVCGALLGLYAIQEDSEDAPSVASSGRFELRIGESAVQSGRVTEGQMLESGKHGHIEVDLGSAQLDLARGTRVRFDRISGAATELSVSKGRLDVDFHPGSRGEERLRVESRAAHVLVLGTRFSVDVDGLGNTEVRVFEGVVEVRPRSGGPPRRVRAGESTEVAVDEGDAYERAVRDAIKENLSPELDVDGADAALDSIQQLPEVAISVPVQAAVVELLSEEEIVRRLELARAMLRDGKHIQARARLQELVDSSIASEHRAEALTLVAESLTAQGRVSLAASTYEHVVTIAPTHPAGHNAQFALARLLERHTEDREEAADAYQGYLGLAPEGALAAQAKEALCRLERTDYCD